MKRTLRKKFILFAMSAVTILLVVLIGAINVFSWVLLDRQSDRVLHAIADGRDQLLPMEFHERGPFQASMNADTVKSARFFMVRMDAEGNVQDVNVDQISSVSAEQAAQYAGRITGNAGTVDVFKYEVKQLGSDLLVFFMDVSSQLQTFAMVLRISCAIALVCWIIVLIAVFLLSGRVVRPILAGMEKQKQFITNAGHELKTPLTIIRSNNDASALIYGETKYSQNIRQQTQRLNGLMSNLLTLAKLDEEITLPTVRLNVSALINGMLPAYEEAILQRRLVFSADIQPDIMMQVHADTFAQMLSVLLDNAVKYTPEEGQIRVAFYRIGERIELVEENTCHASDRGDPERLFERFYRGDPARTQDHGGVSGYGIGLSAARAIAEAFGGTLKATYMKEGTIRFTARFS